MEESSKEELKILQQMKDCMNEEISDVINGTRYIRKCKFIAELSFKYNFETEAIFYLTECHAAALRHKIMLSCYSRVNNEKYSKSLSELECDVIKFDNVYFGKGYNGVIERLREMPEEWTILQLTYCRNPNENPRFDLRPDVDSVPEILDLFVTRLPCGSLLKNKSPCTVLVKPPKCNKSDGMQSIVEVINESVKSITMPGTKANKKQRRTNASANMKIIMQQELVLFWIKEWICLFTGTLCDKTLSEFVTAEFDKIFDSLNKNDQARISNKDKTMLYQIFDSCAHLSNEQILSAVSYCLQFVEAMENKQLVKLFVDAICKFKDENMTNLMSAKRNPILLILDDNLDIIPWECLPILLKHPVSRVPSLQVLHALYLKHRNHIVKGNRVVKNSDVSFYIINPDRDLSKVEETLIKFITQRTPKWVGVKGHKPSRETFIKSLLDYNVLMYSGHGNGVHLLNPIDVCKMNVDVVPFLFGCSSVKMKPVGGMHELSGASEHFLIAGCPCIIGMQWPVTTGDTDLVTIMLLNMTMSGPPVNLNEIIGSEEFDLNDTFKKEPQLLRALRLARSAAQLYTNGAALVARGLPITFVD